MTRSDKDAELDREADLSRYSRQIVYPPFGREGQERLTSARVTLIGCGALGSVIASNLVRAGVGFLRLVDRDYIELNNLQRQDLFDEQDIADGLPKAIAAARKLEKINSNIIVEPHVVDARFTNIETLIEGANLILDGADNFETRFLINDAAVKYGVPWVYGACLGATGMVMPIIPRNTPCLRCIWVEPPPPGTSPTCDTAGVLGPVVHVVAGLQCVEAIKLLIGRLENVNRRLVHIDAWANRFEQFDMQPARRDDACPCCRDNRFDYLSGQHADSVITLCGRDAVQINPSKTVRLDLDALGRRLGDLADASPKWNQFMLRFTAGACETTVFPDGRAIIKNAADEKEARVIYARYIGI
jgi:molybdopterin/thiamine biosynthesis adenylyltransferase